MNDLKPFRNYGEWAGNPKGLPEDKSRCVAVVRPPPGWISQQCSRKRGFGPNGEYCQQHARKVARINLFDIATNESQATEK